MIDFRYHIVSLVAVFLALALGILLGSSVASGPLEARLRSDLVRARAARSEAQAGARQARSDLDQLRSRVREQVGPWANQGRASGRPVLVVTEPGSASWRDDVVGQLTKAGAIRVGSIAFADRLGGTDADRQQLLDRVRAVVPGFDPGDDAQSATLRLLGERLLEPTGTALANELAGAGFVSIDRPAGEGAWPPRDVAVVVFAGVHPAADPAPKWTAAFVRGVAEVAPTLVVAPEPNAVTALQVLDDGEPEPKTLVTFDAAGSQSDPGGIGLVAALQAAIQRVGGDYGVGPDRTFVPAP